MCSTPWENVSHTVNHQHFSRAELVVYIRGARHHTSPTPLTPINRQKLHVTLRKCHLLCWVNEKWWYISLLDCCSFFQVARCVNHTLASCKFFIIEEPSNSIAHFNEQLSINITIILKEKHWAFFASRTIGIPLYPNIIFKSLSFLGNTEKCKGGIKQPIHTLSLALEVNTNIRY